MSSAAATPSDRRRNFVVRLVRIVLGLVLAVSLGTITDTPLFAVVYELAPPPLPATVLDRDASVTVTTRDEDGVPVEGVRVSVLIELAGHVYQAGGARTGPKGLAKVTGLPRGAAWVVADAPGKARASASVVLLGERSVELAMLPEHTFVINVVDNDGHPVPNAEIEVVGKDPLPYGARTDAQGRAEVGRLGEAPWVVTVRALGYDEATARGVRDGAAIKITLRRLGSILVTVVDASSQPVQNARVRIAGAALWPAREGHTGEHGQVKLSGLFAGTYALRATFESQASPIELGLSLESGENKELTLRLAPGRMVIVHTVDGEAADAEDVGGARVVLAEGGLSPFPIEGVTGHNGQVRLGPIAQGEATVQARADGFVGRSVQVPEPLTGEVRLVLARAGAVVGRVVDARGFPIGGATVELVGNDFAGQPIDDDPRQAGFRDAQFAATAGGPAPLIPAGDLGVVPGPVPAIPRGPVMTFGSPMTSASLAEPWVSANDGTFRASPATPGHVRVLVRHPMYVEGWSDVVTVPAGGEAHVEVVLHAGGSLEGRVLDPQGRPVAGARLELLAVHGTLERTAKSSTDGTFAFAAVPKDLTLDVYADDEAVAPALRLALTVNDGERREVTLTLPAAREAMAYRVRDDRGYPIEAAQVSLTSLDVTTPLRETSFTDNKGEGQLAGARGLAVRLEVSAPGHAPKIATLDAAPAEIELTLSPAASASGSVRTQRTGDPIAGADVVLYTAGGVRHLRTDAAGAFSAADLAPGPGRVRVTAQGYAPGERAVTIAAGSSPAPQTIAPIDLSVEAEVEGEVLDGRGDPVQGARVAKDRVPVYLASTAPQAGIAITDAHGRFHLGGLGEGNIALEAYAPDVGRGRVDGIAVQSGRSTTRVRIVIRPEGAPQKAAAASATVAVTLGETNTDPREVVIVLVADGSEAERAGLLSGDTLLDVDGASVHSIEAARERLNGPQAVDVLLTVRREGKTLRLRVGREPTRR